MPWLEGLPKITLEPVIFLFVFFNYVMNGAQQMANLKHDIICLDNLNRSITDCAKRSFDTDLQIEVQKIVNIFDMKMRYIGMIPALVYSIFAGALSDQYGRKPLVLFPLIGHLLTKSVYLIASLLRSQVPLEFFYMGAAWNLFGGMAIYYMGVYGFGSNAAQQEKRAVTLARYDGIEMASILIGSALSPYVYNTFGYIGSFLIGWIGNFIAIIYLLFFTSEPLIPEHPNQSSREAVPKNEPESYLQRVLHFLVKEGIQRVKDTFQCIFRKRKKGLRTLLFMVFFNYWIYIFILEGDSMKYVFMLRKFIGFTGADFALFNVIMKLGGLISLFVVVPFFSGKLQIHETIMLTFFSFLVGLSRFISAFSHNLWPEFYIAGLINFVQISLYCTNRSLITRCVGDHEIGKCFSAVAIFSALVPIISAPAFRVLYQDTIESFPGAIFILAGAVMILACALNAFMITQRHKMEKNEDEYAQSSNDLEI